MEFQTLDITIPKQDIIGFKVFESKNKTLIVSEIKSNSSADLSGLKENDIILAVENIQVKNRNDLLTLVKKAEKSIKIKVKRDVFMKRRTLPLPRETPNEMKTLTMQKRKQNSYLSNNDVKSMQNLLLAHVGCRVGMEISRSPCECLLDKVKFFEKKMGSTSDLSAKSNTNLNELIVSKPKVIPRKRNNSGTKSQRSPFNNITSNGADKFPSQINRSETQNQSIYENNKFTKNLRSLHSNRESFIEHKTSTIDTATMGSSTSSNHTYFNHLNAKTSMNSMRGIKLQRSGRNLSHSNMSHSMTDISVVDTSSMNSNSYNERQQYLLNQVQSAQSSGSLFESSEHINTAGQLASSSSLGAVDACPIAEYKIQWDDIYSQIKSTLITGYEVDLIDYFKSSHADLKDYPTNCLYRFVTLDDAMQFFYNKLLNQSLHNLRNSTDLLQQDFYIPSNNELELSLNQVETRLKMNLRTLDERTKEYRVRNTQLINLKNQLKNDLMSYFTNKTEQLRMQKQIDRLYIMVTSLASLSTSIITSIALWKFHCIHNQLYTIASNNDDDESVNYTHSQDTTHQQQNWINNLMNFMDSQRNLECIIVHFFNRFDTASNCRVIELFDSVFSEIITVGICLPIFEEKLRRDTELMKHFHQK